MKLLPEKDPYLSSSQQGLYNKFDIQRTDGQDGFKGKHHGCEYFVLDMTHDKHAIPAILAYAESCKESHPKLSRDLQDRFGEYMQLTLTCGCNTLYGGFTCMWKTESKDGTPATAFGVLCEKHFEEYDARPQYIGCGS